MSAWLSHAEVIELTGKQRWTAQCRALAGMGVPFRPNAQGRPLVERGAVLSEDRKPAKKTPNWDRLRRAA